MEGDKAVLFMPNVPEFAVAYFAVQRLGAIIVPINAKMTLSEVEYVLDNSEAKVLIAHELLFDSIKELTSDLVLIKTGGATNNWISFDSVLDEDDSTIECDLPDSSESTIIIYIRNDGKTERRAV